MKTARFVDGENALEFVAEGFEFGELKIQHEGRTYSFEVTFTSEERVSPLREVLADLRRKKDLRQVCKSFPSMEFGLMDILDVDDQFRTVLSEFPEDTDLWFSTNVTGPDENGGVTLEIKIFLIPPDHDRRSWELDEFPQLLTASYRLAPAQLKTWVETLLAACED